MQSALALKKKKRWVHLHYVCVVEVWYMSGCHVERTVGGLHAWKLAVTTTVWAFGRIIQQLLQSFMCVPFASNQAHLPVGWLSTWIA